MLKRQIYTALLEQLNPCRSGLANYKKVFGDAEVDLLDILNNEAIPASDKLWLCRKVLPQEILEVFAIDCAFAATEYAAAIYAIYAADAADAADAATNDATYSAKYAAATYAAANAAAYANAAATAADAAACAEAAAAAAATYAAAAAAATYDATYAATNDDAAAAYADAAEAAERERQVDALIYLIKNA